MILPCIDLMDGKVVQLVQGRDKALEGDAPLEMLRKFAGFPEIQVIDLDAAMGRGENSALVELLASRAKCRIGGGVRNPERARRLLSRGLIVLLWGRLRLRRSWKTLQRQWGRSGSSLRWIRRTERLW